MHYRLVFTAVAGVLLVASPSGFELTLYKIPFQSNKEASFFLEPQFIVSSPRFAYNILCVTLSVGTILGLLLAPLSLLYLGRRLGTYVVPALCNLLGALLCSVAYPAGYWIIYLLGRLVYGVAFGISLLSFTIYITECCPSNVRALFGSSYLVGLGTGSLLAILCHAALDNTRAVVYLHCFTIPFSILSLFCVLYVPESPCFLLIYQENLEGAYASMQFFRNSREDLQQSMIELRRYGYSTDISYKSSLQRLRRIPEYRTLLTTNLLVSLAYPATTALFFWTTSANIFSWFGATGTWQVTSLLIVWIVNSIAFIIAPVLIHCLSSKKLMVFTMAVNCILALLFVIFSAIVPKYLGKFFAVIIMSCSMVSAIIGPLAISVFYFCTTAPLPLRPIIGTVCLLTQTIISTAEQVLYGYLFIIIGPLVVTGLTLVSLLACILLIMYMPKSYNSHTISVVGRAVDLAERSYMRTVSTEDLEEKCAQLRRSLKSKLRCYGSIDSMNVNATGQKSNVLLNLGTEDNKSQALDSSQEISPNTT